MDKTAIRDAATVLVIRDAATVPRVLMGQRGAGAAFMPNKVVFPGGAVDPGDADVTLAAPLDPVCASRIAQDGANPAALATAAIRELWEETGLMLGAPGEWPDPPAPDWADFAARGMCPSATGLRYVFRAVTPKGRPRRFDARFFLVEAGRIAGDPDDFSAACEELSHLQWIPLAEARRFDLPFITEVVLAEVAALVEAGVGQPESVPFFDNTGDRPAFRRIA
ncbi:NUDIX hydrolase [Alkalilacustris brevis]|uniref:NUDIX hydrolase n=1 Tax=Alkalilacustris brevis TaxID=2026338 RepID=UPI000E0D1B05|nr:NUDIX hydrolase [Alkalilacustris brevis]